MGENQEINKRSNIKKIVVFIIGALLIFISVIYLSHVDWIYNNDGTCTKIGFLLNKFSCESQLAILNQNMTFCENIDDGLNKVACFYGIARTNATISSCNILKLQIDRSNCYATFAEIKNDTSSCLGVPDDAKNYCIKVIAIRQEKLSICDLSLSQRDRDSCYTSLAEITKNASICNLIKENNEKDNCLQIQEQISQN